MAMEVKIISSKDNPLLKRKEVNFRVEPGPQGKAPGRREVKKALAAELKLGDELVFIQSMKTSTGTSTAFGSANAYEKVEQAKLIEPEYIIKRNHTEKPRY